VLRSALFVAALVLLVVLLLAHLPFWLGVVILVLLVAAALA